MKRIILTLTIVFAGLGMFCTLYVFAYNCGDTWASAGPDTFTGGELALRRDIFCNGGNQYVL